MARIRSIKPELPQSESMGKVSREARLLFILMWTLADDEGRLRGNSRMLASLLFPYDDDAPSQIDRWIFELIEEQCIVVYEVGAATYVQICNWLIHQKIDKPSKSKIPEFGEASRILANRRGGIKDQGSKDQGSEEGKGTSCAEPQGVSPQPASGLSDLADMAALDLALASGTLTAPPAPAPAAAPAPAPAPQQVAPEPAPQPVVMMPLVGEAEFGILQSHIDGWVEAYPGVDVIRQLAAMRQWSLANPRKRKTTRGVLGFCNSWLMKEQDKAGARLPPAPRGSPQKGQKHDNFASQDYRAGVRPDGSF